MQSAYSTGISDWRLGYLFAYGYKVSNDNTTNNNPFLTIFLQIIYPYLYGIKYSYQNKNNFQKDLFDV